MGEQEPAPEQTRAQRLRGHARGFLRERSGKQWLVVLVAVALLLTAPFGGLRATADPAPERLRTGHAYDIGPFDVTVRRVLTVGALVGADGRTALRPGRAGDRLFVVALDVVNDTRRPQALAQVARALSGKGTGVVPWPGEKRPEPRILLVADASSLDYANPGVRYEIALVLEQSADWRAAPVTLSLNRYELQEDDPIGLDDKAWVLRSAQARGIFDVRVRP